MLTSHDLALLSNEDLAAECAKRPVNEDAWREFWRRFYPFVYRKVANLLWPSAQQATREDVDDVVQLVFLNIFTRLPRYDRQKSPLTAYLTLVATSTVIDELRRAKGRPAIPLEEDWELADRVARGELEADELWQVVLRVLDELEPRDRGVVEEVLQGEPAEAICGRHGVTSSQVYTITYRFRQAVRQDLKKKH